MMAHVEIKQAWLQSSDSIFAWESSTTGHSSPQGTLWLFYDRCCVSLSSRAFEYFFG